MRLLVLGAEGQLGRALQREGALRGHAVVGLGRAGLDLAGPFDLPAADLVINAGAYTAVDKAETEVDAAHAVNGTGAGRVAEACARMRSALVHVSTDYVFDGLGDRPYREDDAVAPLSVYGASKLDGEERVRKILPGATIVRTAWVFSETKGFVRTILDLARQREVLQVTVDEVGCPTFTGHLAKALLDLAFHPGCFHWAGSPPTSRFDFARAIVEEARGRLPVAVLRIEPIALASTGRPARRPPRAVLDVSKAAAAGAPSAPWIEGVKAVVAAMEAP